MFARPSRRARGAAPRPTLAPAARRPAARRGWPPAPGRRAPAAVAVPSLPEPLREQVVRARLALELLAEVGMRQRDERLHALGNGLPLEVHDPVLRDDVHDVGARRGHDVARRQRADDAALPLAALLVRRREADEGLAAPRRVGAAHELELPAGAGQVAMAGRLRGGLAL